MNTQLAYLIHHAWDTSTASWLELIEMRSLFTKYEYDMAGKLCPDKSVKQRNFTEGYFPHGNSPWLHIGRSWFWNVASHRTLHFSSSKSNATQGFLLLVLLICYDIKNKSTVNVYLYDRYHLGCVKTIAHF